MKLTFFMVLMFVFTGCQTLPPTTVRTISDKRIKILVEGARSPLVLSKDTIVLDSRSAFDYSLLHLPEAINISWREFSDVQGPYPGVIKKDLYFMTARLSRLGIGPNSPVIVVGYGSKGHGDEARLAWMLYYLGVKNIQFSGLNYFKARVVQKIPPPRKAQTIWSPRPQTSTLTSTKEIKKILKYPPKNVHIIDVRTSKEALNDGGSSWIKKINIHSHEFITQKGRPDLKLKSKLKSVGILPTHRVIVISNKGLRSSTALMSLLSMGYKKASHFVEGWKWIKKLERGQK